MTGCYQHFPVKTSQIAAVCVGQILTLAGYSAVPALLPRFVSIWSLNNTQAGWLADAFYAGYMAAVLPLVALTDRIAPRRIYIVAAALSVAYYLAFASVGGWLSALVVQPVGGIALAGLYMPGLRSIVPAGGGTDLANGQGRDTSRAEGGGRARTVAWYTSSFTLGASLHSCLPAGWGNLSAGEVPWSAPVSAP